MVAVTYATGWLPQDLVYSECVLVHILVDKCHMHAGFFVMMGCVQQPP